MDKYHIACVHTHPASADMWISHDAATTPCMPVAGQHGQVVRGKQDRMHLLVISCTCAWETRPHTPARDLMHMCAHVQAGRTWPPVQLACAPPLAHSRHSKHGRGQLQGRERPGLLRQPAGSSQAAARGWSRRGGQTAWRRAGQLLH